MPAPSARQVWELRSTGSTLVKLAELLDVPVKGLAGIPRGFRPGKRGSAPKLQQLERITLSAHATAAVRNVDDRCVLMQQAASG